MNVDGMVCMNSRVLQFEMMFLQCAIMVIFSASSHPFVFDLYYGVLMSIADTCKVTINGRNAHVY